MKKLVFIVSILPLLTSCSSNQYVQIGSVNMISNRNISSLQEYSLIKKFSSASPQQITNSRAHTVNDAVDNVVKTVPGGEYLMNVKLYRNSYGYFAAEGDVWGVGGMKEINGLGTNQIAIWNRNGRPEKVKVLEFKSNQKVSILTKNNRIQEVDIAELLPDAELTTRPTIGSSKIQAGAESNPRPDGEKPKIQITTLKGEVIDGTLIREELNYFLIYDSSTKKRSFVYKDKIEKSELQ